MLPPNLVKPDSILIADDDEEDRLLIRDAFKDNRFDGIVFAEDGEELMDLLMKRCEEGVEALPSLILLDLNMPRKDGWEALREIKASDCLKHIPVVVFSTSSSPDDIASSYELGGNSYLTKPGSYEVLVGKVKDLIQFWFKTAEIPKPGLKA
jgi:CheY-like chemotaxis protein